MKRTLEAKFWEAVNELTDATVKGTELNLGHGRGKRDVAAKRQRRALDKLMLLVLGRPSTDPDWEYFSGIITVLPSDMAGPHA